MNAAATNLSTKVGYKVPYRMTEGNTCYRGGKPGVSDVFGASLWAADYLLTLASLGYSGVNLHGGSGKAVADSLGGTLPGELLMPDPKAPHPRPFYTPIAEVEGKYVAEPVFYGMLFTQEFAGSTIRASAAPGRSAIACSSEAIATQSSVSASSAGLHATGSRSTANPSALATAKV